MLYRANRRAQKQVDISASIARRVSERTCRLCGDRSAHAVLGSLPITQDAPFLRDSYDLLQCPSCECIYLDPLPDADDLRLMYETGAQFSDPLYADSINARNIVSRYQRRFAKLQLFPLRGQTLLEIGAGHAWVSRACKFHDARITTIAQDVSSECVDTSPWVDQYFVRTIEELPRTFTAAVVSLTHVIEHLPAPGTALAGLTRFLPIGGHIYITAPFRPAKWMPDDGFEAWRRYSYMHVPAHLQYLSRRWFEQWCAENGFEIRHWDDSTDAHQAFEVVLTRLA